MKKKIKKIISHYNCYSWRIHGATFGGMLFWGYLWNINGQISIEKFAGQMNSNEELKAVKLERNNCAVVTWLIWSWDENPHISKLTKRIDQCCHKGQGCTDNCNYFGLSEISVWFQRCCLDKILDSKSSTDIVLCFLQLYMEEVCFCSNARKLINFVHCSMAKRASVWVGRFSLCLVGTR